MNNKKLNVVFALTCSSFFVLISGQANATIYKCINAEQKTYYNDKPCPVSDNETQLKNAKDPIGGYIPPKFTEDASPIGPKGVLIGKDTNKTLEKSLKEESDNVSLSGDSSSSSTENNNSVNDVGSSVEVSQSGSDTRTVTKTSASVDKPVIPLKKEVVTREARDNTQYLK